MHGPPRTKFLPTSWEFESFWVKTDHLLMHRSLAHAGVGIHCRQIDHRLIQRGTSQASIACSTVNVLMHACRYVARLVLLHGRIMYKRNTEVVWYSFYKNWMHNLTFIFFAFVSGEARMMSYTHTG
eukprot:893849-Pelagomonas_calceolata.AAC.1